MNQFLSRQAEMQKYRNLSHKEEDIPDEDFDSADDLGDTVAEEVAISQKIPESFVGKYTQRTFEQVPDHITIQDRKSTF